MHNTAYHEIIVKSHDYSKSTKSNNCHDKD